MINLIPTAAKKNLRKEYWVRVITVWFFLLTGALCLSALLLLPTYVLISSQLSAYIADADAVSAGVQSYTETANTLDQANKQAVFLLDESQRQKFSTLLTELLAYENEQVSFSVIGIERAVSGTVEKVEISGEAATRQALTALEAALIAHKDIIDVQLPLSNFTKVEDVPFFMTVTLATSSKISL